MKTKRRHELQTNQLADWLGNKIQAVKPHTHVILGSIVAGIVVIGIVVFLVVRGKNRVAEQSAELVLLNLQAPAEQNPREYEKVSENLPQDSRYVPWALKRAGDIELNEATNRLLYEDRVAASSRLRKAKELFTQALNQANDQPLLYNSAEYSLAQTHEALGEVDEALKLYKQLLDKTPDSAIGKGAKRRIEKLENETVVKFYEQFASYVPPEPEPPELTMDDLPERPDLEFPGDYVPLPARPELPLPNLDEATSPEPDSATSEPAPSDATPAPGEATSDESAEKKTSD